MALTDYDKERLRAKYEQWCYKQGVASDLFDFNAELDSSLEYWEAWGNIEDKLEALKPSIMQQEAHRPQQAQQYANDRPLSLNLDRTDSIAILGDRQTGKTNLAFYLLNSYRGIKDIYLYGYPKSFKGFKSLNSWQDILKVTDSIIYIDEIHRYIKLYDRKANTELMELMSFLAHQGNTLIFSTQLSQFITKGVEASIQTWLIKRLDIGSLKNGSRPKRIIKEIADARITDKGMALNPNEVIAYDGLQDIGFSGVHTYTDQGIGKDWKTATKTLLKTAKETAKNLDKNKGGEMDG